APDLRVAGEALELLCGVVARNRRRHAARRAALARAYRFRRTPERGLIGGHEFSRARQARQSHAGKSGAAEVLMSATVLIDPGLHEAQPNAAPLNRFSAMGDLGHGRPPMTFVVKSRPVATNGGPGRSSIGGKSADHKSYAFRPPAAFFACNFVNASSHALAPCSDAPAFSP